MEIEAVDEIINDPNVTPLYIAEVYLLLKQLEGDRNQKSKENNPNFLQFEQYIKEFTPSKDDEEIQNLRTQLMNEFSDKISQSSLVEIVNVMPNTIDEAKSLIRSLAEEDDELIQRIVDTLNNFKKV